MFFIPSNDNANIAVYELNPNAHKTIVLIHGWPLSHKMFEYQLPVLMKNEYRVISIDIRGFGNSDVTSNGYNYSQFANDLYYVIYALNLSNFDLLGFSMGGAIATKYMQMYNEYGVRKLCLLDSAVPSYSKTANNPYGQTIEATNNLIKLGYNDRPALNEIFGNMFFYKKPSIAFKNWFQNLSNGSSGIGEMSSLIALRDEDIFNSLQYIHVPTAIFHGKEDKICPFPMAEIMHNNIRSSILFPFENAGHGSFYDVKDEFNSSLIKFLNY